MAPDEDERQGNTPLLVMTGLTFGAIVGVYAWFAWKQNTIFERALTDLAASRRRGPVIRTTPEPSNEEVAASEH
jgi:HAMP domain-containing protein